MTDSSNQSGSLLSAMGRGRRPYVLAILVLLYLVLALFSPILSYEFIDSDTPALVLENPSVHGLSWKNVKEIFAGQRTTSSYYPIRALTYAFDYTFWGLEPIGFKLTNLLIHVANVLLVFWLILRLFRRAAEPRPPETWWDASVAGFAAGVFALHGVVVEPVVWVPGREELLMVFWTLACFHCYLTARRSGTAEGDRSRVALPWYVGATVCCLFACLSNAVAAVVPLLITVWDTLTLGRANWRRILYSTAVLWVIGCLTVFGKQVVRHHDVEREMDAKRAEQIYEQIKELGYGKETQVGELAGQPQTRLMLVLNIFWRNVVSIAWPSELGYSYKPVVPHAKGVLLGLAALAVILVAMWMLRRRKLALFGLLWFGLALGPASQIMDHHIHRADRFLYLPLVGLAVAIALSLRPASRLFSQKAVPIGIAVVGLATLLTLYFASVRQVRTWENSITMWEHCVRIGPENFTAHRVLADRLAKAGEYERANVHFEAALKINAFDVQLLSQFAGYLVTNDNEEQRDYELAIRLASWAGEICQWDDPEAVHTLALAYNNYAVSLGARGDIQRAAILYEKAIERDPNYAAPLFNLALLRITCPDTSERRPEQALRLAKQACQLAEPSANELMILAMAYAQTGQADQAVATVERAVVAADAAGNVSYANSLRERLRLFRSQESVAPKSQQ